MSGTSAGQHPFPASGVRARAPAHDARLSEPVWEVWVDGAEPVGPVSADQIARGLRAGRVPSDASIKRATDVFWSDLLDVPEVLEALKKVSVESVSVQRVGELFASEILDEPDVIEALKQL